MSHPGRRERGRAREREKCVHMQVNKPVQCWTRRIQPPGRLYWQCDEDELPSLCWISLHSSSALGGTEHMCAQAAEEMIDATGL